MIYAHGMIARQPRPLDCLERFFMLTSIRSLSHALLSCLPPLTLLAALPVGAQTLTLGSQASVTPKTSGTATISASGTATTGTAKFTGGASTATTNFKGVVLLNASTLTFQEGGTINTILFNQNTSVANIYGGNVKQTYGYDQSVTNIYGGTVFYPQSVGSSLGGGRRRYDKHLWRQYHLPRSSGYRDHGRFWNGLD